MTSEKLNKSDRLRLLLAEGFFPSQVPPCFTSFNFASKQHKLAPKWNSIKARRCTEDTECERYSVPRAGHSRRPISIANPVSQYYISRFIADNWGKIYRHLVRSKISLSRPVFKHSLGRSITISSASEVAEEKLLRSAGARFAVITDIAQFFPSLYTHAIPWALHGKAIAKDKKNRNDPKFYGNALDELMRACQSGQTIGVPIGPDTSHIVAEIIGVAIDLQVKANLGAWPKGLRHVDDFYLFFDTEAEAVKGLAAITQALQSYELRHNVLKTRIIPVQQLNEDSWTYGIGAFEFSHGVQSQRKDIHRYFDYLFGLEKNNADENVVLYGLRKLESEIIKRPNWAVFQAYLFRCILQYPNTIQDVAAIVSTYTEYNYPVAEYKNQWSSVLNSLLQQYAPVSAHGEVAWVLWLCDLLGVRLNKDSVTAVEKIKSPICLLMALNLENRGLVQRRLNRQCFGDYRSEKSLYKDGWLLAYEGAMQGWLPETIDLVKNDRYFCPIYEEGVSFFSREGKIAPIFKLRKRRFGNLFQDEDFDADDDITHYFKFSDIAENYLGGKRRDNDWYADEDEDEDPLDFDPFKLGDDIPL